MVLSSCSARVHILGTEADQVISGLSIYSKLLQNDATVARVDKMAKSVPFIGGARDKYETIDQSEALPGVSISLLSEED